VCGGEDQYLCNNWGYSEFGCDSGYTLDVNVIDDWTNLFGKCTECGGEGQLVCANPFGTLGCDDGYAPDPDNFLLTCTACGDIGEPQCWTGPPCQIGRRPYGIFPNLFCEFVGWSAEPTTNSTVVVQPQGGEVGDPVWGFADIHEHQFANLAYGGTVLWGSVFDEGGINKALAWCDYTHDFPVWPPNLFGYVPDILPLPQIGSWGWPVHGSPWTYWDQLPPMLPTQPIFGLNNKISTSSSSSHDPGGATGFEGWPRWDDGGHQQMYYMWVKRAFEGGLRLLVNHTVNNEVLCEISYRREGTDGEPFSCDDMDTVDRQIARIYQLQDYIDELEKNSCNDPPCGWYRVVTSPQQAREVIRSGKMAVVIGIEVDTLFRCKPDEEDCDDPIFLEEQINIYKNKGVRHVFPVHAFDNRFTGAALYETFFAFANYFATGARQETWDCWSEGYDFKITPFGEHPAAQAAYGTLAKHIGLPKFDISQNSHCNKKGLTSTGEELLNLLIKADMIVDVDHFSHRAMEGYFLPNSYYQRGVIDIMQDSEDERGYTYPVISSHTSFAASGKRIPTEFYHPESRIEKIRDLGGIIMAPLGGGAYFERVKFMGGRVGEDEPPNEGPYGMDYPGIGIASDIGAFLDKTKPRKVDYPFPAFDGSGAVFHEQETGGRKFDMNKDGFAHYGMLPDLISYYWSKECRGSRDHCTINLDCSYTPKICYLGDNDGEECVYNEDCPGGGTCKTARYCYGGNNDEDKCLKNEDCSGGICSSSPLYCFGGDNNGVYCAKDEDCSGGGTCSSFPQYCYGGENNEEECLEDADCSGEGKCRPFPLYCFGGDNDGEYCLEDAGCSGGGTCSSFPLYCLGGDNDGEECVYNEDCPGGGTCEIDTCVEDEDVATTKLVPLFNSAETYIRMWERIENCTPDTTSPEISCPADQNVECPSDISPDDLETVIVNDPYFCGDVDKEFTSDIPPDFCDTKSATRTWTATDDAQNTSSCTQTITVADETPPDISCPADIEVEPTSSTGATVTYTLPVGSDNCQVVTTVQLAGLGSDSLFPIGSTTSETYMATDKSCNNASCTFTVTVLLPIEVTEKIVGQIEALVAGNTLTQNQADGLIDKLNEIMVKLESPRQLKATCYQIEAFIKQVKAFVTAGILTGAEGDNLMVSAINTGKGAECRGKSF